MEWKPRESASREDFPSEGGGLQEAFKKRFAGMKKKG